MLSLRNKKVTVLGLLDPGLAAIRFLQKQGAKVIAVGVVTDAILQEIKEEFKNTPCQFFSPEIPKNTLLNSELVIQTSGGGRKYSVEIEEARAKGVPILTDLEFACQYYQAPMIAVTGTNGKTSVVKIIQSLLEQGGKKVLVAGGDYQDFCDSLLKTGPWDFVLLELNSSRLFRLGHFHPHIAVLLNLYPGHSERHGSFEEYSKIKAKIFKELDATDYLVCQDQQEIVDLVRGLGVKGKVFPFSFFKPPVRGTFFQAGKPRKIVFLSAKGDKHEFVADALGLEAVSDYLNLMAGVTVAKLCGIEDSQVQAGIRQFKSLPNRLEFVRSIEGVRYFNDAKSVNVASTSVALDTFPDKNVILIAGGQYKSKQFYNFLLPNLEKKVRVLVLFGEYRRKFEEKWGKATETYVVPTLMEAVQLASKFAQKGDVVLFSPACVAESHVHANPKARGDEFKRVLGEIAELAKIRHMAPKRL